MEESKTLDLDEDLQEKHQAMLDCLSNRHRSRFDNSIARRSDSTNSSESTSSFLSRFSDSKQYIDSQLSSHRSIRSISDLEKLVAENSYILPPYEVSLLSIIPERKFSLKNKSTQKGTATKKPESVKSDAVSVSYFKIPNSLGFRSRTNKVLMKRFWHRNKDALWNI